MLDEPESEALRRFLDAELQPVSNLIVRVELARAMGRSDRSEERMPTLRSVLERFQLLRPTREILERAAQVAPRALRTLDAIHLATALDLSPPPELFLCYDRRLAAAARAHGLAVVAPGVEEVHEP